MKAEMSENAVGKLSAGLCAQSFLTQTGARRPEVKVGPSYGVDVAIVQLPGGLGMALTSDPLSLIPTLGLQESAWLSVHLMANDMATTGHAPHYAQFVLNLPVELSDQDYRTYWHYIDHYCAEIGVAITGGHSGKIAGQHSTIAGGGTMVTVAPLDSFLTSNQAQQDNLLLVAGEAAIVSTAILSRSFPATVQNRVGNEIWQSGCDLFYKTSSLQSALTAVGTDRQVTAMHDVTEGGIIGAIHEMAVASGKGVLVDRTAIPVGLPQQKIMESFHLDPLYTIGAGATLMAVEKNAADDVLKRLHQAGIAAAVAGSFTDSSQGQFFLENGKKTPLTVPAADPYWAAFFEAFDRGFR